VRAGAGHALGATLLFEMVIAKSLVTHGNCVADVTIVFEEVAQHDQGNLPTGHGQAPETPE
jgi:hypothetical protein